MAETNGSPDIIDPELEEELAGMHDEMPIVEYSGGTESDGADSIEFASDWFPGQDEWQGKTVITQEQAHALSIVRNITDAFPMLEPIEDVLIGMVQDYEKYQTSVQGLSREQQTDILRSMFGDNPEDSEYQNVLATALTAKAGEDDD